MKINKNLEANIGVVSILLTLSPFISEFKTLSLGAIFPQNVTVFDVYLTYSLLFMGYVLFQLYYDVLLSTNTNINKRITFEKLLAFMYYIILSLPFMTMVSLILLHGFVIHFEDKELYRNSTYFLTVVAVFIYVLYLVKYISGYKNFKERYYFRMQLNENLQLCKFLILNNEYQKSAELHYDLAKKYLIFINNKEIFIADECSITDCVTESFIKNLIVLEQKTKFEAIAKVWDQIHYVQLESEQLDKRQIFLNQFFLEREINIVIA